MSEPKRFGPFEFHGDVEIKGDAVTRDKVEVHTDDENLVRKSKEEEKGSGRFFREKTVYRRAGRGDDRPRGRDEPRTRD